MCVRGSVVLLDSDGAAALVLASGKKALECNSGSMCIFWNNDIVSAFAIFHCN
ncbi:hypothetical protein RchiOBHm_Chr3g0493471 [Rosa chinensis]|uniref:Uncharacterized protein n=1 Tax=Rosa chinensis TaxID=74649 RepID=A0A2P6RGS3_ROSCH|nr:hypothetical protein RchiOBHm_Chr3g0493471 [Rosa chinensis]